MAIDDDDVWVQSRWFLFGRILLDLVFGNFSKIGLKKA